MPSVLSRHPRLASVRASGSKAIRCLLILAGLRRSVRIFSETEAMIRRRNRLKLHRRLLASRANFEVPQLTESCLSPCISVRSYQRQTRMARATPPRLISAALPQRGAVQPIPECGHTRGAARMSGGGFASGLGTAFFARIR